MSFFKRLETRAKEINSLLCVGLDPHPDDLKVPTVDAVEEFCMNLVRATLKSAVAYKPNIAFFEAFGAPGISTLQKVISAIPAEIPVILDAKRGDIASSAEAYARSVFNIYGAQAVTVSPYLGRDSLEPFLRDPERGVFLLCKTSNPGSADLQDLILSAKPEQPGEEGITLFEKVAQLACEWNAADNLGLVVGATHPEALGRVRRMAPELWILAPGVGAQGGELHEALQAGLREDNLGMLLPVSRGISRSSDPGKTAEEIRMAINEERFYFQNMVRKPAPMSLNLSPDRFSLLADGLLEAGCIKFGEFTLKSGLISPIYIDLRQVISFPGVLRQVAQAYLPVLARLQFDRLAGLPYAAVPITTMISILGGMPFIYPRKEVKAYGTKAEIEGLHFKGERIVIIDDLATTGSSKFEAIDKITSAGLIVEDVVVLIDRQSGAAESMANAGINLHAVFTLEQLLDHYETSGKVNADQIEAARRFIAKKQ